jgi:hypothetical protein
MVHFPFLLYYRLKSVWYALTRKQLFFSNLVDICVLVRVSVCENSCTLVEKYEVKQKLCLWGLLFFFLLLFSDNPQTEELVEPLVPSIYFYNNINYFLWCFWALESTGIFISVMLTQNDLFSHTLETFFQKQTWKPLM